MTLPLAISFFTFQQIAYLVDSHRGETKEYGFINYTLFVTFFPQLIAGPIVHHKEMMPQFIKRENFSINYKNMSEGIFLFTIGLFKKIVLADMFAIPATLGFDNAESLSFFPAWMTSLSYTLQLYFDFSGYTDMAIGSALIFNIKLPINFNSPYRALNIQLFWRRWHITLSRFLKEYLYIPLGGNQYGKTRTGLNLLITFVLGGIWHGAGWTFLFWGLLHGFYTVIHRSWTTTGIRLNKILSWLITFNCVNIAWVFFRAKNFEDALKVLKGMTGISGFALPGLFKPYLNDLNKLGITFGSQLSDLGGDATIPPMILIGLTIILLPLNSNQAMMKLKPHLIFSPILSGILIYIVFFKLNNHSEFIYFNF
jgi:D-alanyl-lipoteichoic acid acyltransferase DltB (MBOAT superfamily)